MKFDNHIKKRGAAKTRRRRRHEQRELDMATPAECPACHGRNSIIKNVDGLVIMICGRCDGTGKVTRARSLSFPFKWEEIP